MTDTGPALATTDMAPPVVTREDVERLIRFDAHGARILSVYLDLDPERQVTRSYRIVLEDLVKGAERALSTGASLC